MTIDATNSFDIDEAGLQLVNDSGDTQLYFTSGQGSPVGSPAPINTIYWDQNNQLLYYKFGSGNNDWRQIRAQDITFDPSTTDLTQSNVQTAIEQLANRHFGKDFAFDQRLTTATTNSTTFLSYQTLDFSVNAGATNVYRIATSLLYRYDTTARNAQIRLTLDGAAIKDIEVEPKENDADQRIPASAVYYAVNLAPGPHQIQLQGSTESSSDELTFYEGALEVWRVS